MSQELLRDSRLFAVLSEFDQDLAAKVRERKCRVCRASLDWGNYPRKPRGVPPNAGEEWKRRYSLCCSRDGCRTRETPPSVRFFGRRFYAAPVFVLVWTMIGGITEKRVAALEEFVSVSIRTLRRWRTWWREKFPTTAFWKAARARVAPPLTAKELPERLLQRFAGKPRDRLLACLRFLTPVTTSTRLSRVG